MRRRTKSLSIAVLTLAAVSAVAAAADGPGAADGEEVFLSYSGTATGHAGNFLYRENHVLHFHGGRLTERVILYSCRNGAAFARKTVAYGDALAPDFLLDDMSNGMREGVRGEGATRQVFFREDRTAAEKSSPLPQEAGLVIDAGFDEFLRTNWPALLGGEALAMKFLVPSRLEAMNFKVQHLRRDAVDGVAVEVFRLKVAGVVGWVAPSIDVYYSVSDHVLTRYVGISDLRGASHDNLAADIDFRAVDRHPSAAAAMQSARQAPLAPCQ